MEGAAGRGGSLPVPASQPPRKEWRAVSEHSFRSNGSEDLDHIKLGQSDERTIYEEGAGQPDGNFCSIDIDRDDLSDDIVEDHRIRDIVQRRRELQEVEIELKAQAFAKPFILEARAKFEEQLKEHGDNILRLEEQLREKDMHLRESELKLEEKERELRALKIDTEAVWAKEDLLREQNKELATFRRELDNSEAERAHHLKQIHDLQEHIQEKESQFLDLQEKHRVAQETIVYKDDELRAWIARVQEMALQSNTNQSLQAELRERIEQFNQYYPLLLRQCSEMERYYVQVIQQLQLELVDAREQNGPRGDGSQLAVSNSTQASGYAQSKENQSLANENGNSQSHLESGSSFSATSNGTSKNQNANFQGVPSNPHSVLPLGHYLSPGQISASNTFSGQQQLPPVPVASSNDQVPPYQFGHFQSDIATPVSNWQNNQDVAEASVTPGQSYQPSSITEQTVMQTSITHDYGFSSNRLVNHTDFEPSSVPEKLSGTAESLQINNEKLLDSGIQQNISSEESSETLSQNSQYNAPLGLTISDVNAQTQLHDKVVATANHGAQGNTLKITMSQSLVDLGASSTDDSVVTCEPSDGSNNSSVTSEVPVPATRTLGPLGSRKDTLPALLDEKALLACIVRAIPLGSNEKIRISTTLPNRLGKMLAPLHWHDYRKQYGKLEDFLNCHPELFVIEGDFIHLREGAQKIVSANAAAAKFAAAASASAPYSSHNIALTPVAHGHRQKMSQTVNFKSVMANSRTQGTAHGSARASNQQHNSSFDIVEGLADVKILTKSNDLQQTNGFGRGRHLEGKQGRAAATVGIIPRR